MGEADLFPILFHYRVGTVAAGRLRYVKEGETRVTADTDTWIRSFAQRKTVDMIIGGIAPDLHDRLIKIIGQFPPGTARKRAKNAAPGWLEKVRGLNPLQKKEFDPMLHSLGDLTIANTA